MAKDRARPFSRKHVRYWMTAAGGEIHSPVANQIEHRGLFRQTHRMMNR